jgi:heat shock protein HslJ
MLRIVMVLLCAAAVVPVAIAGEQPLICFGNEPSWSVHLTEPGVARFATPDSEPVTYRGASTRHDILRETLWRGSPAAGRDLVVWLQDVACSDAMSDTEHPVTARVSSPDGHFLSGCCRAADAAPTATNDTALEGATWQLAGDTPKGLAQLQRPVTVRFEAGRVHGFSGCNSLSGGYHLDGDQLKLEPMAATMMACAEPAMSIENAFHAAFSGTLRYAVEGDKLTVSTAAGETLQFARAAPPKLDGGNWKVTSYNNNRQAVVGVIGDPDITLSFSADTVSGSAGCNTFRASYTIEGNGIQFGPAVTTRRSCEEKLMTQESLFLAALASAVTWSIDGNVLDMHRADSERAIWAIAK